MRGGGARLGRSWLLSAALGFALLSSAVAAAFDGSNLSTLLQLPGILIPLALGIVLFGRHFLEAPALGRSPLSGLLTILFLVSGTVSACLAAAKFYDPFPLMFEALIVFGILAWGGIWAVEDEIVLSAFRMYCVFATGATMVLWIATRHSGERFHTLMHPNIWGLLCFANFCLSGLFRKVAFRTVIQISNILVILDAQSRSALLSTIIAAAILLYFGMKTVRIRREDRILVVVAALCAAAVLAFLFEEQVTRIFADAFRLDDPYRGSKSGFSGRTDLWQNGFKLIESNPLFGVGPRMESYYITGDIPYAHSGYISTFAQFGVIGGALFFGLELVRARKLWLMAGRQRPGAAVAVALVMGYAADAFFEPKLLSIGNPASLLLIAFLLLPARRRQAVGWSPAEVRTSGEFVFEAGVPAQVYAESTIYAAGAPDVPALGRG